MNKDLIFKLSEITEEEKNILMGEEVQKTIYTSGKKFIVDNKKLIEKGKLIEIRTHTRFIHFPKHSHNYIEMVYMCQGNSEHIINNTEYVHLQTGDLLLMNQNVIHEVLPCSQEDIAVNFIILPEFFYYTLDIINDKNIIFEFIESTLSSKNSEAHYLFFKVGNYPPIQNLIENMIWTLKKKNYHSNTINQLTMSLMFLHLSEFTDIPIKSNNNSYEQKIVMEALKYIKCNYKCGTLNEFSVMVHLKPYTISKILKKNTGMSFKSLLIKQKMHQASYFLSKTSLTNESILQSVGYENSSYFHKKFKEIYGKTPKNYRLQASNIWKSSMEQE